MKQLLIDNMNEDEIEDLFSMLDYDGNNSISFTEFLAARLNKVKQINKKKL